MLATPPLAVFVYTAIKHTCRELLFLWGLVGAIFGLIWGGASLLNGG